MDLRRRAFMMMRNQRKKMLFLFLCVLFLAMMFVAASGEKESNYALFGARSSDKKANVKAFVFLIRDVNTLVDGYVQELHELLDYYNDRRVEGKEKILAQEPMIWETDALFEERLEHELGEWDDRLGREADSALEDISKPLEEELETLYDLLQETQGRLATSERIQLPVSFESRYASFLRNERLWPLTLTFSDRMLKETSLDLVIDFTGQVRSEEEIRSSIVAFDRMVRGNLLNWKVAYHIIPDVRVETDVERIIGGSNFYDIVRFLFVLDEVTVSDDRDKVLFRRKLENPVLLHSLIVDDDLNFILRDTDSLLGLDRLGYEELEGTVKVLRSHTQQILLADPLDTITDEYEKNRLGIIPPVATPSSAKEMVFRISNGAEPESLDPALIQGVPEHRIYEALFEGLVSYDPETSFAVPGVAESWTSNADGTQYTFKLRKDALWSDGVPITAHDVVYSWLRILNPRTGAPYAWFPAMFLVGAEEFNAGWGRERDVGIRALDDHTFQMDLIGPLPYAIDVLAHYSFAIMPKHTIEKYGQRWTDPANFVGNGPFVLTGRIAQTSITVSKSPTYWDRDKVSLSTVIFYSSDSPATNYNMYLNGELDWVTSVPPDRVSAAQMRDDFQASPQLATYYYVFQTEKAPINNRFVRQALSLAIDREALVDGLLKAGQIPAWGIVPPMAGYDGLEFPFRDMGEAIKKAQDLLAKAGYPNGAGFPVLSILYNTDEGHKQIAEFIQQEWRKNLGIRVVLENQEWGTYLSNRNRGNFVISRAGWVGDYQDPNAFLDMFITGAGMNGGKYSNEIYDLLINEAARMPAGADRFGVLTTAEDIMINGDQAVMPLYYYVNLGMIDRDKWGGWYPNTMDIHPLKDIYLR